MANKESTKDKIIRVSTTMFLEVGYSKTSPQMIAKELEISTGNLTYYYPTKEDLLAVLVEMLCDFQIKLLEYESKEGMDSIMSICIELMTVAAACEGNEVAKDFLFPPSKVRSALIIFAKVIFLEQKRFLPSNAGNGLMSSLPKRKFLFSVLTTLRLCQPMLLWHLISGLRVH